jgi:hypothetical protein
MTIDDLLFSLLGWLDDNPGNYRDGDFAVSLTRRLEKGIPLTAKQAHYAKNMLVRYSGKTSIDSQTWDEVLRSNKWVNPPIVRVEKRNEARFLGDNLVGLYVEMTARIRESLYDLQYIETIDDMFVIPVTRQNITNLVEFLVQFRVEVDSTLDEYLGLCLKSHNQTSYFVTHHDDILVNVKDDDLLAMTVIHMMHGERI